MSDGVAGLSMYDWHEVQKHNDALWEMIFQSLKKRNITAPQYLTREKDHYEIWLATDLIIGQTCGLNAIRELQGRVEVLGALDYGLESCQAGQYRSVIVCRVDDEAQRVEDFVHKTAVINSDDSYSGYGALLATVNPFVEEGKFFEKTLICGSHRQSIKAIANKQADIAAIDEVVWNLAFYYEPAVDRLRVIGKTQPMPAPPLITNWSNNSLRNVLNEAIEEAVSLLDETAKSALQLYGYKLMESVDYEPISIQLNEIKEPQTILGVKKF